MIPKKIAPFTKGVLFFFLRLPVEGYRLLHHLS